MLMRMWSNKNSQSLLAGMQNGTATLEDNVSYKTKHTFTKDPAIALLGIYPKKLKTYVHTETCIQMFITAYNCPNLEATKMPFSI